MNAKGFTIVEVVVAIALGALVLLVLFRAYTGAVAAQADTEAQIAGHQQARATAQWIAGLIQASSSVRPGHPAALELAGSFGAGGPVECVGVFAGRLGSLRGTVLYEQRRSPCPEGGTSAGGTIVVVSDPTVSTAVTFEYRNTRGRAATAPKDVRLVEVVVAVDVNRDGQPDYSVRQMAAIRGDYR